VLLLTNYIDLLCFGPVFGKSGDIFRETGRRAAACFLPFETVQLSPEYRGTFDLPGQAFVRDKGNVRGAKHRQIEQSVSGADQGFRLQAAAQHIHGASLVKAPWENIEAIGLRKKFKGGTVGLGG
jgi:hypothetical protein